MAEGHGWGGASRADSNHPRADFRQRSPPFSRTYVAGL